MEIQEKKELLNEYGLTYEDAGESSRCRIAITGTLMAPIRLAGKMFGIEAFSQGISGRPYEVLLAYGESAAFYVKTEDGSWNAVPEALWQERLSGLTDSGIDESLFVTKVVYPCEMFNKADVLLKSLETEEGQPWNTAFWETDRWCMALSATKLLSSLERAFLARVKYYYHAADYVCYLGEMEQIPAEEDRMHIAGSVETFAGQFRDGLWIGYRADEVCPELFADCEDTVAVLERRDARRVQLQLSGLKVILQKKSEELAVQAQKLQEKIDRMQRMGTGMVQVEEDFCRQIRIYHLRELQQRIYRKLEEFDESLQQRTAQRIREEDNLSALAENIAACLTGEWETYLKGGFAEWSAEMTDSLNRTLWEELKEQMAEILRQNGNQDIDSEDALELKKTIENDLRKAAEIRLTRSMTDLAGSAVKHEKGLLDSEALPIVFIAAGAVAGIAGALLPGLAFAAIGVKSKMNQQEEKEQFRKEIMANARLQEKQILKHMKEGIDTGLHGMESKINQWIHERFARLSDGLRTYCEQQTAEQDRLLAEKTAVDMKLQGID